MIERLYPAVCGIVYVRTPAPHGKLADIDPALIVKLPKGFEIGYVPIATRHEMEKR